MFTVRNQFVSFSGHLTQVPREDILENVEVSSDNSPDVTFMSGERHPVKMLSVPQANDERILERHLYVCYLKEVTASGISLSAEQKQTLTEIFSETVSVTSAYMPVDVLLEASDTGISDAELWDMVADTISAIGEHYLGVYENVVEVYTHFYQDYSDISSSLGGWLSAGEDGNTVKLDVTSLKNELNQLIQKYGNVSEETVLFPTQSGDTLTTATEAEARQWLDELDLPESCLVSSGTGYVILVDLSPVQKMVEDIDGLGTTGSNSILELDNAKYQAWQSGFKSQEESMNTTLQILTQKYSNAYSLYDNLVTVLSSTISSCLEAAKSFLER